MADLRVQMSGDGLLCVDAAPGGRTVVRPFGPAGLARLTGWSRAYGTLVRTRDPDGLPAIGREIAAFLNGGDRWLDACIEGSTGPVTLEVLASGAPDEGARALLDVPWELLTHQGFFLAEDARRLFLVARRLGGAAVAGSGDPPAFGDIAALFMAAEVEGQKVLDYEREELAFLEATQGLGAHLSVEESGSLEGLRRRLRQSARWDVLHLTGHGDVGEAEPFLALETPEGGLHRVSPGDLCGILGDSRHRPKLVFLSACRTAEQAAGGAGSFVQALVQSGVPNALGWDGSVHDLDATRFAALFYGELAGGQSVVHAAAVARRGVLADHRRDRTQGSHWHLARVWLGPGGGGALCDPALDTRAFPERKAGAYLDKEERVKVATPEQFVGRRRSIQAAFRAWAGGATGLLIQGMGNLGKSSLAERIADRLKDTHAVAVLFERYDAHAVLRALVDALPEDAQQGVLDAHEADILRSPAALKPVIRKLLKNDFSGHGGTRPVLLIVDDLERCLADPRTDEAATPFRTPEAAAVMAAIVGAFRETGRATKSRLLITSRYSFALGDATGKDLAASLTAVPLPPMDEAQRTKQMRAAVRIRHKERPAGKDPALDALEQRIRAVAGGNPGLQEILTRPLLDIADPAAARAAAERAVAAVEGYLDSGAVPEGDSAAKEFFDRVSLGACRAMLTPSEARQFAAAALFERPVPRTVLEAAGTAATVANPRAAVERLHGLGLLDRYGGAGADSAVNPLARPLAPGLSEGDQAHLAAAVVGPLHAAWVDGDGDLPFDPRAVELARLALLAGGPAGILDTAAHEGGRYLFNGIREAEQAWQLVEQAIGQLDHMGAPPSLPLLRLGVECAERLGKVEYQENFLARATGMAGADPRTDAMVLVNWANRLIQTGHVEKAEGLLRDAVQRFGSLDDARSRAAIMGRIADILTDRGEVDEALRIRREVELPVFERLGDVRSRAVTMGRIADVLTERGEMDEALRIRREEQLPVYEYLGDVREYAATMGRIADILVGRGEINKALSIRYEEQLPIFERLGDVRSRAIAMGQIADILTIRGEKDEALRIRREEELLVYERLGDVRSRAVTMGKISDILTSRGETDEALRILREEQLPVFERLGYVGDRAITMGRIADILTRCGEIDEALRIRREEELPVFERLGNVRERAITMSKIADILTGRGETNEALRIRREEELPVFERLGDVRSCAITMSKIADILTSRGEIDEALRIRREEELPVFKRLGDVRSCAITMSKIADILTSRGEIDEALRIRREEELPVFKLLGDVRSCAITMGRIADILTNRGEIDEALRIHLEERLPVAQRLWDMDSLAHIRFSCASLRLERGGLYNGEAGMIADELAESYAHSRKLGRVDFIGPVGALHGQVLAMDGKTDEALRVLDEAEGAYAKLKDADGLAHVRTLQAEIRKAAP
ncbi:AAA ATPase-like protein [Azospirillum brasilense]|uniref:AAA ATPase-like protein n=1 Tax=Azospirillum brasilense TaxID=192 RepID=A0A560C6A0_AZOBR|nr:CHAT domain-containing protein [Azospirillum brasilense]TWA80387.1 AAA ATPase-like protein [Azospirillum brasilense]